MMHLSEKVQFQNLALGEKFQHAYEAEGCIFEKLDDQSARVISGQWVNKNGRLLAKPGEPVLLAPTEEVFTI